MVVAILLVMIRVLVGRCKRVRGGEVHLSNFSGVDKLMSPFHEITRFGHPWD